jgi:hypothetical protein
MVDCVARRRLPTKLSSEHGTNSPIGGNGLGKKERTQHRDSTGEPLNRRDNGPGSLDHALMPSQFETGIQTGWCRNEQQSL